MHNSGGGDGARLLALALIGWFGAMAGCHAIFPFDAPPGDAGSEVSASDLSPRDQSGDAEEGADQALPDAPPPDAPPPDAPPDAFQCKQPCKALGCDVIKQRCFRLQASSGLQAAVSASFDKVNNAPPPASNLLLKGKALIDTKSGAITDDGKTLRNPGKLNVLDGGIFWTTVARGAGLPPISLFVLAALNVQPTAIVEVKGDKPLALYVIKEAWINGGIVAPVGSKLVSGAPSKAAAGGSAGGALYNKPGAPCLVLSVNGAGRAGIMTPCNYGSGGGGGGHLTKGGKGGAVSTQGGCVAGAGGLLVGKEALIPLVGGCGGGAGGGDSSNPAGPGGGGGGAIQITVNGELTIGSAGWISMPGGGGGRSTAKHGGGGGGGAGGAILLEAPQITIAGGIRLSANGGGGGAGGFPTANPATMNGANGGNKTSAGAKGGIPYNSDFGAGGKGGALVSVGLDGPNVLRSGGGGGGAAGRIRCNMLNPPKASPCGGTASPGATTGPTAGLW